MRRRGRRRRVRQPLQVDTVVKTTITTGIFDQKITAGPLRTPRDMRRNNFSVIAANIFGQFYYNLFMSEVSQREK